MLLETALCCYSKILTQVTHCVNFQKNNYIKFYFKLSFYVRVVFKAAATSAICQNFQASGVLFNPYIF